jgi:hypothetical protein
MLQEVAAAAVRGLRQRQVQGRALFLLGRCAAWSQLARQVAVLVLVVG